MSHDKLSSEAIDSLMTHALAEAQRAAVHSEVPVGAVIWKDGEIIASAHNEVERSRSVTAHAECLAINRASEKLNNWRLDGCVLCVTLEPCTMCIGAIQLARIPLLIFGCYDPRLGAVGSRFDLAASRPDISMRIITGIKESACRAQLNSFFEKRRKEHSSS